MKIAFFNEKTQVDGEIYRILMYLSDGENPKGKNNLMIEKPPNSMGFY